MESLCLMFKGSEFQSLIVAGRKELKKRFVLACNVCIIIYIIIYSNIIAHSLKPHLGKCHMRREESAQPVLVFTTRSHLPTQP